MRPTSGLHIDTHTQIHTHFTYMNGQTRKGAWWHGPVISVTCNTNLGELQVQGCLAYRVNSQLVLLQLSGRHIPWFQCLTLNKKQNAF